MGSEACFEVRDEHRVFGWFVLFFMILFAWSVASAMIGSALGISPEVVATMVPGIIIAAVALIQHYHAGRPL